MFVIEIHMTSGYSTLSFEKEFPEELLTRALYSQHLTLLEQKLNDPKVQFIRLGGTIINKNHIIGMRVAEK